MTDYVGPADLTPIVPTWTPEISLKHTYDDSLKNTVLTFKVRSRWAGTEWNWFNCLGTCDDYSQTVTVTYRFLCADNALLKAYDFTGFTVAQLQPNQETVPSWYVDQTTCGLISGYTLTVESTPAETTPNSSQAYFSVSSGSGVTVTANPTT